MLASPDLNFATIHHHTIVILLQPHDMCKSGGREGGVNGTILGIGKGAQEGLSIKRTFGVRWGRRANG